MANIFDIFFTTNLIDQTLDFARINNPWKMISKKTNTLCGEFNN